MFKEYAVDPETIASSWETCRLLIDLFGFHQGRVISRFPKRWKRLAIEAADKLEHGRKQEQVVEMIHQIGREFKILIRTGRDYTNPELTWLDNAILAHKKVPFSGIISSTHRSDCEVVLHDEDCFAEHPLLTVERECLVPRIAEQMADAASFLLKTSKQIKLIDAHFDPSLKKWRSPLKAFLNNLTDSEHVTFEIHYLETYNSPDPIVRYNGLSKLSSSIPQGMNLKIFRWRQKEGGEKFHARYLLTENGGLRYDVGLDEGNVNESTDVCILDKTMHQKRWQMFNPDSIVYSLQDPIYIVNHEGDVIDRLISDL